MNAIREEGAADAPNEPIRVLITMHEGMDSLDFTGPLTVLNTALHKKGDKSTRAFNVKFVGESSVTTEEGMTIQAHLSFKQAYAILKSIDVLIVPGGGADSVLSGNKEPIAFISAFAETQKAHPDRERTLMSVCTGSLLLAKAGVLQGLSATTHPDYDIKLEKMCQEASARVSSERTDVLQERYVVNNARFDLGDIDENPFVIDRREMVLSRRDRRRSSVARKGSMSWKESNTQEQQLARRAALRLGGLRVITAGAVTCGLDASLYLVCAMVSQDSAEEAARVLGYTWQKGVVVEGLDV